MQILITRACDVFNCSECTQLLPFRGKHGKGKDRDPVHMSVDVFERAVDSMAGWRGIIALFGGNPAVHPEFPAICEVVRAKIPPRQRGLWTNNLNGHGPIVKETFWPNARLNLNVHHSSEAAAYMREWLPGKQVWGEGPVEHSSMLRDWRDMGMTESEWIAAREQCDINQKWSGAIMERDGAPYGYFCEVAGSIDGMRGENNGVAAMPGWWRQGMDSFGHQVRNCCDLGCGVPLRAKGSLDTDDTYKVSQSWVPLTVDHAPPKVRVEVVGEIGETVRENTDYVGLRK